MRRIAAAAELQEQQAVLTDCWQWLKQYRFINETEWQEAIDALNYITTTHKSEFSNKVAVAVLDELERLVRADQK